MLNVLDHFYLGRDHSNLYANARAHLMEPTGALRTHLLILGQGTMDLLVRYAILGDFSWPFMTILAWPLTSGILFRFNLGAKKQAEYCQLFCLHRRSICAQDLHHRSSFGFSRRRPLITGVISSNAVLAETRPRVTLVIAPSRATRIGSELYPLIAFHSQIYGNAPIYTSTRLAGYRLYQRCKNN